MSIITYERKLIGIYVFRVSVVCRRVAAEREYTLLQADSMRIRKVAIACADTFRYCLSGD